MRTQNSREILQPQSFATRFLRHDPLVSIRAITKALVGIWPEQTRPKNLTVMSKRAKIMNRSADPIAYCYTLVIGGLDEGKSLASVTQWAHDLIAAAKQYADRMPTYSRGVIPISEAHDRMLVAAIREDAEADCREATVDLDSIESLEAARSERTEAMSKDERKVEFYTARIAELRSKGA